MNCPSCGTDEFYEGFLSRECKNPTCKLYTEKHAEACRKPPELTPRLDQVKPLGVCSTCNDTGTINMTGARVSCPDCQSPPNRLGGLFKWMPSKNTVQPASKPPAFPGPIDISDMVDAGILSKSEGVDLIKKLYPDTDQVVFGPGSVSRTVFGPSKP